jgi:hypothetical protein
MQSFLPELNPEPDAAPEHAWSQVDENGDRIVIEK